MSSVGVVPTTSRVGESAGRTVAYPDGAEPVLGEHRNGQDGRERTREAPPHEEPRISTEPPGRWEHDHGPALPNVDNPPSNQGERASVKALARSSLILFAPAQFFAMTKTCIMNARPGTVPRNV